MGGHQSTQSVNDVTKTVSNSIQQVTKSCISYAQTDNTVAVAGTANAVSNITQTVSIQVNSQCASKLVQNSNFQNSMQNSIVQQLKNKSIALTEWMDGSKDNNQTNIEQIVGTNVTSKTVLNCVNNLNSRNIITVAGTGNVVNDVVQKNTVDAISNCLLSNTQASNAVSNITNAINQGAVSKSENPLAFITDAIGTVAKSGMMTMAAIAFIIIICFVGLFLLIHHHHDSERMDSRPIIISTQHT